VLALAVALTQQQYAWRFLWQPPRMSLHSVSVPTQDGWVLCSHMLTVGPADLLPVLAESLSSGAGPSELAHEAAGFRPVLGAAVSALWQIYGSDAVWLAASADHRERWQFQPTWERRVEVERGFLDACCMVSACLRQLCSYQQCWDESS